MSVITCPIEKSLYFDDSGIRSFITLNAPDWLKKIQENLGIAFNSAKVGGLKFSALEYHSGHGLKPYSGGFTEIPSLLTLFALGLDARIHLLSMMKWFPSELLVSKPQSIKAKTAGAVYPLTGHDSFLVNIDIADANPAVSLAPYDPFSTFKQLASNINALYQRYQAHNPFGSCRNIKQIDIELACKTLCNALPDLKVVIPGEDMLQLLVLETHEKVYLYFSKATGQFEPIFRIIRRQSAGSYKLLHQMLGISNRPKCYAHLVCSREEKPKAAELAFRTLFSPDEGLYMPELAKWTENGRLNILTDWASYGHLSLAPESLSSLLLEGQDKLALQLLEMIHQLHRKAVHRDLHHRNILDHKTKTADHVLSLTDFGTWAERDPKSPYGTKKHLSSIDTHSQNLAPELIRLAFKYHPLCYWEIPFEVEESITFENWVLSERWVIARLISHIYLGTDPYEEAISAQIETYRKEHYTFFDVSFEDAYVNPTYLRKLFAFIDESIYTEYAVNLKRLNISQTSLKEASPLFGATSFEFIDKTFEEVLEDPELFYKLHLEVEKSTCLKPIYENAYKEAIHRLNLEKMGLVSYFIIKEAPSFLTLIESSTSISPKVKDRLLILAPLLDFDPSKRPELLEIHALLEALTTPMAASGGGASGSHSASKEPYHEGPFAPAHGGAGAPS